MSRKSPRWTRQDYEVAAKIISKIEGNVARHLQFEELADDFAADNPRFDRARFQRACRA